MQSRVDGILRAVNNKNKHYNILTAPTHESFQSNWASLPHNFYMYQKSEFVKWKEHQRPLPKNHILLDGTDDQIKLDMVFDIVLAQQIFGQIQHLKPLADYMNLPLIRLEHTTCESWKDERIDSLRSLRGDINVFITKYSVGAWHFDISDPSVRVINHAINTELFKPDLSIKKDGKIKSVVNDFIGRSHVCGFDIHQRVTAGLPIHPVGDTKGFSDASSSQSDLIFKMQESSVFLNTSRLSPLPMSLLEAASFALPIVSTNTCGIPDVFTNGYDAWLTNDEKYMRDRLEWCLKNPEEASQMGSNARKTIIEKCSMERHLSEWSKVFNEAYGMCHKG